LAFPCDTLQLFYRQNKYIFDNNNKQEMIITTQKYQTINITKLLNTLNLNFKILNNKLIFTHKLTNQNLKDINKILKTKYSTCYKIYNK
jgi:mannose-6-phosphate isomerase class I